MSGHCEDCGNTLCNCPPIQRAWPDMFSPKQRSGRAGAKGLRERLGSDEAVRAHYQELQRKGAESRRRRAQERADGEADG